MNMCQICCWNDADYFFNDDDYSLSKINNYNFNENNYNPCYVCNSCLLEKIYCCNLEQKNILLKELLIFFEVKNISIIYNIPVEIFRLIFHKY